MINQEAAGTFWRKIIWNQACEEKHIWNPGKHAKRQRCFCLACRIKQVTTAPKQEE